VYPFQKSSFNMPWVSTVVLPSLEENLMQKHCSLSFLSHFLKEQKFHITAYDSTS